MEDIRMDSQGTDPIVQDELGSFTSRYEQNIDNDLMSIIDQLNCKSIVLMAFDQVMDFHFDLQILFDQISQFVKLKLEFQDMISSLHDKPICKESDIEIKNWTLNQYISIAREIRRCLMRHDILQHKVTNFLDNLKLLYTQREWDGFMNHTKSEGIPSRTFPVRLISELKQFAADEFQERETLYVQKGSVLQGLISDDIRMRTVFLDIAKYCLGYKKLFHEYLLDKFQLQQEIEVLMNWIMPIQDTLNSYRYKNLTILPEQKTHPHFVSILYAYYPEFFLIPSLREQLGETVKKLIPILLRKLDSYNVTLDDQYEFESDFHITKRQKTMLANERLGYIEKRYCMNDHVKLLLECIDVLLAWIHLRGVDCVCIYDSFTFDSQTLVLRKRNSCKAPCLLKKYISGPMWNRVIVLRKLELLVAELQDNNIWIQSWDVERSWFHLFSETNNMLPKLRLDLLRRKLTIVKVVTNDDVTRALKEFQKLREQFFTEPESTLPISSMDRTSGDVRTFFAAGNKLLPENKEMQDGMSLVFRSFNDCMKREFYLRHALYKMHDVAMSVLDIEDTYETLKESWNFIENTNLTLLRPDDENVNLISFSRQLVYDIVKEKTVSIKSLIRILNKMKHCVAFLEEAGYAPSQYMYKDMGTSGRVNGRPLLIHRKKFIRSIPIVAHSERARLCKRNKLHLGSKNLNEDMDYLIREIGSYHENIEKLIIRPFYEHIEMFRDEFVCAIGGGMTKQSFVDKINILNYQIKRFERLDSCDQKDLLNDSELYEYTYLITILKPDVIQDPQRCWTRNIISKNAVFVMAETISLYADYQVKYDPQIYNDKNTNVRIKVFNIQEHPRNYGNIYLCFRAMRQIFVECALDKSFVNCDLIAFSIETDQVWMKFLTTQRLNEAFMNTLQPEFKRRLKRNVDQLRNDMEEAMIYDDTFEVNHITIMEHRNLTVAIDYNYIAVITGDDMNRDKYAEVENATNAMISKLDTFFDKYG